MCQPGKYTSTNGLQSCSDCTFGKHQPDVGKSFCFDCSHNFLNDTAVITTVSEGSESFNDCVCGYGHYPPSPREMHEIFEEVTDLHLGCNTAAAFAFFDDQRQNACYQNCKSNAQKKSTVKFLLIAGGQCYCFDRIDHCNNLSLIHISEPTRPY